MFGVGQIYLNKTELHISGSVVVAVSIVSRTNDINTGICHARVQIVDVLQLWAIQNQQKSYCLQTNRNAIPNLPNRSFAITPQGYCNASIKIRC